MDQTGEIRANTIDLFTKFPIQRANYQTYNMYDAFQKVLP